MTIKENGITFDCLEGWQGCIVKMTDPVFGRPWYLKKAYNGEYDWTRDSTYAKHFSVKTARKHIANLEAFADKDWPFYHNQWKEYFEDLKRRNQ